MRGAELVALLDLDDESRRALEFDAVLDAVAGHAATAAGSARVRSLAPRFDAEGLEAEHAAVAEAAKHLGERGRLVQGGLPDPGAALRGIAILGLRLDAAALRDLAVVLVAAGELRAAILRLPAAEFPRLRDLGVATPDLRADARDVVAHVTPDGRISDEASPELRRIRAAAARVGERLRRMLESYLHEPGAEAVIRDDFVTQRNGRYVIPVRADAPRSVRGIVHAASSSGATLFVEPMESVDLNNEIVRLAEAEAAEQDRVVELWGRRFRDRHGDVLAAVDGLTSADSLQARALFAAAAEGVTPRIGPGVPLRIRDARHPLLDRRLREQGARCVPASLDLDPPDQVLVLSGPNTGGKTVALKTVGLAVLMAHSGLPVTAKEASLPLLRQVRADIGDHQSIEADLSTFSAHVRAVARFLEAMSPPALFLFDEIGTGTEPTEGAALAQAVLERLVAPGITAVATTHQGVLKAWAFTTPGAASAAMEFDEEALKPTFRILMGAAGVSAGVEIAARLGLADALVERARSLIAPGGRQTEAYLYRLRELVSDLEERRANIVAEEERLAEEHRRLASRAADDAERRRRRAQEALEEALREFREQGKREIQAIQDRRERARLEKEQAKAEIRLRSEIRRKTGGSSAAGEAPAEPPGPVDPRPGLKVRVLSLGREGEIASVRGDKVEVRMGRVGITVRRDDLAPAGPEEPPVERRSMVARAAAPGRSEPGPGLTDDTPTELMLIGKTVDEALPELDRFLDQAALHGTAEIRVVHGHGTGRLRASIRLFLRGHPHVENQRSGEPREGGDGATVVRVK
jgi:DNA mismatch repair protein MutS2